MNFSNCNLPGHLDLKAVLGGSYSYGLYISTVFLFDFINEKAALFLFYIIALDLYSI